MNRAILMAIPVLAAIMLFPLGSVHGGACNFILASGVNEKVKGTDDCDFINALGCDSCKIIAGNGDDTISVGNGADKVLAGSGNDMITMNPDGMVDVVNCGSGYDKVEYDEWDGSNPDGDIFRSCEDIFSD